MAEEVQQVKSKKGKGDYVAVVGRRKEAVARVRLYQNVPADLSWDDLPVKKGDMLVNGKLISEYFSGDIARHQYTEPLRITNAHQSGYAFTIKVVGGGPSGQLQAVVAGIANALNKVDREKHRPVLKKKGFLTRDARVRERRNVGTGGKARRRKQSPKR